jgi:hypothetical protein
MVAGTTAAAPPGAPKAKRITDQLIRIAVTLKGFTPLLMNAVTPEELIKIRDKIKAPKGAPRPTPAEEAEKKVYKDVKGNAYIPDKLLWACLVAAGQHVRLDGKRQMSTAKSTVLPTFLTLLDKTMALDTPGWETDVQQGRNPNGGELVVLCRPRFDVWRFRVHITIDTNEISEDKIRELFDIAGKRCGLGDFRPNRKGIYGQFLVECWDRENPA